MPIKEELLKLFAPVFAEVEPRILTESAVALFLILAVAYVVLRIRRKEREHTAEYERRLDLLKAEIDALAAKKRRDDESELQTIERLDTTPIASAEPLPSVSEPSVEPRAPGRIAPTDAVKSKDLEIEQAPVSIAPEAPSGGASVVSPSAVISTELPKRSSLLSGLQKSRSQILGKLRGLFGAGAQVSDEFFTELEEHFISSDLGVKTASELVESVRQLPDLNEAGIVSALREKITSILRSETPAEISPAKTTAGVKVILVVGVNGVGKTTTVGKLSAKFASQGARVVVAACDTFRAAAVEQLRIWGERVGVEVIHGPENSKPSTIAYQAVHRAREIEADVLILDTAGRLHTRVNLMNELSSVTGIVERELGRPCDEVILVLDGATGQNALQQAREFHARVKLTGVVVTKLDGTPKGGIVVAIKSELGVPIRYIGVGEGLEDLRTFDAGEFATALLDLSDPAPAIDAPSHHAQVRRRRREGEK